MNFIIPSTALFISFSMGRIFQAIEALIRNPKGFMVLTITWTKKSSVSLVVLSVIRPNTIFVMRAANKVSNAPMINVPADVRSVA